MDKIALIADSTCDLSWEEIKKWNINILSLRVIYKDREYIDRVTITPDEVYNNLKVEVPTTSLPSMDDMEKLYTRLQKEGYTHTIAITISSGLSGTYSTLKLVSQNNTGMVNYVFDSLALSLGAGALVLECAKMISEGYTCEKIINKLPTIRSRIKVFYVLDTLQYLIKGGRIGKVSGTIGELLNIKPIISINGEGVYYTCTKVRGRKQSISKLIDISRDILQKSKAKIWVLHGGALEEGKELFNNISKLPNIAQVSFSDISPVAGVHTGPGLLGITIFMEE